MLPLYAKKIFTESGNVSINSRKYDLSYSGVPRFFQLSDKDFVKNVEVFHPPEFHVESLLASVPDLSPMFMIERINKDVGIGLKIDRHADLVLRDGEIRVDFSRPADLEIVGGNIVDDGFRLSQEGGFGFRAEERMGHRN